MSQQNHQLSLYSDDKQIQGQMLTPFQRKMLQKSLQQDLRPEYRLRIEIMLLADEGKSQAQICKTLGCCRGTVRFWIALARGGEAHNWNTNGIGRPKAVNQQYLERLQELVSHSPRDFGYPFKWWTAQWLSKHLAKELGIKVGNRHINRLLKQLGLSTRPKITTDEEGTNQTNIGNTSIVIQDL